MSWSENRTRKHRVTVTLSDDEYADVRAFYESVKHFTEYATFARFARRLLTKGFVKQIIFTYDVRELLSEIRRIGTNVNQIAWKVNRENITLRSDIEDVTQQVRALEIEVKRLCREFNVATRDDRWS